MSKKFQVRCPFSSMERVQQNFDLPSLTDQSFREECDIGFIIENFVRTGKVPESTMSYQDCTSVKDYQDAMYLVAEANSNFEQLPSNIRDEFKTVENYLDYISNPNNLKDSYERGLIDKASVNLSDVYPDMFNKFDSDVSKVAENVVKKDENLDNETVKKDVNANS